MGNKVNRAGGITWGAFITSVAVVKAPFWGIYQGVPLGIASVVSKKARRALVDSFDDHIGHIFMHELPAALSGEMLDEGEDWNGWERLKTILWPDEGTSGGKQSSGANQPGTGRSSSLPKPPDLYATLGVSHTASTSEIHETYRRLARIHHPDVNKDSDSLQRFIAIDKAYKVLRDQSLRHKYDKLLSGQDSPKPEGRP